MGNTKADPVTYIDEYKGKTNSELKHAKYSLQGNYGNFRGVPEARVAAIDMILAGLKKTRKGEVKQLEEHNDTYIAKRYLHKRDNAISRGFDFTLSFSEYRRLIKRKTCYYTGMLMTDGNPTDMSHRTIDRVDSSLGYVSGNCVACTNLANSIKATILEDPNSKSLLTVAQFKKMAANL